VIEEALKSVEKKLIAEATIIATTLTRAYLSDEIQSRRFNTVILDEASMAPIPALWVAASVAEDAMVLVGDHKQLPPIVLSKDERAQKWLGKDIIDEHYRLSRNQSHFKSLRCQYRMRPEISRISITLFYDSLLHDDASTEDDSSLGEWYN